MVTAILTFSFFAIAKSKISKIRKSPNETKIFAKIFKNIESKSEKLQNKLKYEDFAFYFMLLWTHSLVASKQGARYLTGENLKVVWAEFSTFG